jgi:hypothetical protein
MPFTFQVTIFIYIYLSAGIEYRNKELTLFFGNSAPPAEKRT